MDIIIIHPNNRPIHTTMHGLSAALISPVSKWYRKPIPWWVDGVEEGHLLPIYESDEFAEEPEMDDCVLRGRKVEDVGLAGEVDVLLNKMMSLLPVLNSSRNFMEIVEEVECDGKVDVFMDMTLSNEEVTMVLEWDETTISIIAELDWAGGKARHEKSKDLDEKGETSITVDGVDNKGNDRDELVWDGDVAWKPKPRSS